MKLLLPPVGDDSQLQGVLLTVSLSTILAAVALRWTASKRQSKTKTTNGEPPKRQIHNLASYNLLLGDAIEAMRNDHRLFDWMTEKTLELNGDPWRIHVPAMPNMVIISSPDLVEEITVTQFDNFHRGDFLIDTMEDLFGRSLVTEDGEKWFHQRKAAVKFFTARALRECMTTNMQKNMKQLYGVFDDCAAQNKPVDLLKVFHEFALQTFAEVGLGIDLNIIGGDEEHPMNRAVEDVTPLIIRRTHLPPFAWKFERWLNIGPERAFTEAMVKIKTWLDGVVHQSLVAASKRIADREAAGKSNEATVKSVVELFLEQTAEDKEGLRAEDLVDFIRVILLASRGTSATALVWIFLMITKHPHVEKRLREEMGTVLADLDQQEYLRTDHVSKLTYLEATIKEVLRLYPTLPVIQKEAAIDTVIGGDLAIKKSEIMCVSPYVMARLPSLWGPDAAEFKPERWIDPATGTLIAPSSFRFTAFSSGPRICIGMKLAMLELRIVTANILRQYDFKLATPNDCGYIVSLELMTETPVMINATKRTGLY